MGIHQSMRKNVVYHAVKAGLDEAGVPHTLVRGSKHPAFRFELDGKPRIFPIPNRPFQGPAVENYRHQVRAIIRQSQAVPCAEQAPAVLDTVDEAIEVVGSPTLTPDDLVAFDDGPRVRDLTLAERLGFCKTHDIRRLINRNLRELESICVVRHMPDGQVVRGHETKSYWLNGDQAIRLCMFARTDRAKMMRDVIQSAFTAYLQMHEPQAVSLPEPDPIEAAYTLVPQASLTAPELLANDTAIEMILDLIRIQNEEQMRGLLREVMPRIVEETVSAVMTPLLRQQAAWGLRKVERIEGAVSEAVQTLTSRLDTGITRSIAVTQKVGTQLAEAAQSTPAPAPRKAWGRPAVVDGIHVFPPVETPRQPSLPLLDMAEPSAPAEPTFLTIQDVYGWQRIPRRMSRSRLSQSIRHSLEMWFGDRVTGFSKVYVEGMGNRYVAYPEADLRRWYETQGRALIAEKIAG